MRTKVLHFFPYVTPEELEDHARRLERLIDAASECGAEASDREMTGLISSDIEITLRTLRPAFGGRLDLGQRETTR